MSFLFLLAGGCGFGEVTSGELYDACPSSCPEGQTCRSGSCVDDPAWCDGGSCPPDDPCEGISCDPGFVCQRGSCVSASSDGDGDGYTADVDCDDGNASVHPGAQEECNGVDDDCDGERDEGYDGDGDGFARCGDGSLRADDCDDGRAEVFPGAEERCNDMDDDCDGEADEGLVGGPCSTTCGPGTEICEAGEWVCSSEGECDCAPVGRIQAEDCGRCGTRSRTCLADGSWTDWGDCEGDVDCPTDCGDGVCEGTEDCGTCPEDCECPTGCDVDGHLGEGENDDPCTEPAETWRCVHSTRWGDWISQVCRDGGWVTFHIAPRDCESCCEDYSTACSAL